MKSADPEMMRALNRLSVLETIRRHGPIARIEISEATQLSTTTVSAITAALIEDGLVLPRHTGDIRTESARGRPRVMLELNPDAVRVVGAKIAADRMVFAVTDFCGTVLSKLALPIRIDRQPAGVIADLIEDGVRQCIVDAGLGVGDVHKLCLALPCVIEYRTGNIRSSVIFREPSLDFAAAMTARLGIPTTVESDAHAITLAHHWFGLARDLDDVVVVSLERTLGLGVLNAKRLFRGAGGLSHNLGDLVLGFGPDEMRRLSDQAGEAAILNGQPTQGRFADAISLGRGMSHVQTLLRRDDRLQSAALRAADAVGVTLANIVTLFAPPRVIVVGSSLALGEVFLSRISDTYAKAVPQSLTGVTELVFDMADDAFWAQGAAALALHEIYEMPAGESGQGRDG
ncbi:MAG: ROK family protein [Cypionkella sp.]